MHCFTGSFHQAKKRQKNLETWLAENHKGSQEQRAQFAEEVKKHALASKKKLEEERAKTRAAAQEAKENYNSLCKWRF